MVSNHVYMPINPDWKAPTSDAFPIIDEGVYQVAIEDAEVIQTQDFNDPTKQVDVIKFTFVILESDFKGHRLSKNAKPYFSDKPGQKKSTLTEIFEAVFKRTPLAAGVNEVTGGLINKFIGRQLKVLVKTTMSGKGNEYSKIPEGGFMKTTSDMELPEGFKESGQKQDDGLPVINQDEEKVDLSKISF